MKTCSWPGCQRKHVATGLCHLHYKRKQKGRDMNAEYKYGQVNKGRNCRLPMCSGPAHADGLCVSHWHRRREFNSGRLKIQDWSGPILRRTPGGRPVGHLRIDEKYKTLLHSYAKQLDVQPSVAARRIVEDFFRKRVLMGIDEIEDFKAEI